jgi:hypothetical protein
MPDIDEILTGHHDLYHVRINDKGHVNFGVKECFDRWANSTDFVRLKKPKTVVEAQRLRGAVEMLIKDGLYSRWAGMGLEV